MSRTLMSELSEQLIALPLIDRLMENTILCANKLAALEWSSKLSLS